MSACGLLKKAVDKDNYRYSETVSIEKGPDDNKLQLPRHTGDWVFFLIRAPGPYPPLSSPLHPANLLTAETIAGWKPRPKWVLQSYRSSWVREVHGHWPVKVEAGYEYAHWVQVQLHVPEPNLVSFQKRRKKKEEKIIIRKQSEKIDWKQDCLQVPKAQSESPSQRCSRRAKPYKEPKYKRSWLE